jgi:hypothetical protein
MQIDKDCFHSRSVGSIVLPRSVEILGRSGFECGIIGSLLFESNSR